MRPGAVVVGWDYGTYMTHGTYDYGTRGQGDCFVEDNGTMGQQHAARVFNAGEEKYSSGQWQVNFSALFALIFPLFGLQVLFQLIS